VGLGTPVLRTGPRIDALFGELCRPPLETVGAPERATLVGGRGTERVGLLPNVAAPRDGD